MIKDLVFLTMQNPLYVEEMLTTAFKYIYNPDSIIVYKVNDKIVAFGHYIKITDLALSALKEHGFEYLSKLSGDDKGDELFVTTVVVDKQYRFKHIPFLLTRLLFKKEFKAKTISWFKEDRLVIYRRNNVKENRVMAVEA